jgi:ribosomal protein L20
MRYMSKSELVEWVVRAQVTEDQRKALKQLAIERDQEVRELVTAALQTSPITRRVFA